MTTTTAAPDYLRQRKFFDPDEHENAKVTFVGVGGIGSFASFAVAKLGVPNITLIDPDIVEPHNLPSQMFDSTQAHELKVEAAASNIQLVNEGAVRGWHMAHITENGWDGHDVPKLSGLVVSGLDSMKARTDLWHQAVRLNVGVPLYIDGRLDGETIVIYAVKPWDLDDVEQYEATLLSDDDVEAGECTARNIIDVGFTVAAQIARLVRLHYNDAEIPKITVVNMNANTIAHGGWLV